MKIKGKRKTDVVSATFIAAGITVGILLAGLLGVTHMVLSQKTGEASANIYIPVLLLLATLVGGQVSSRISEGKPISTLIFGLALMMLMGIGGFLLDGPFRGALTNICAVLTGTGISLIICLKRSKGKRKMKGYR